MYAALPLIFAVSLSGEEIMKKVDSLPVPKSSESHVRMIIKKGDDIRERKLIVYTKNEGGKRYSATKFLEPADVRGTQFLQISNGETYQFLYLPSLKKSRRISASQKSSSFMGSEITYEDMERRKVDDYEHKLLREDDNVYVVETYPKKNIETQYSKAISWVDKKDFSVLKIELYDKNGKLLKIIENQNSLIKDKYIIPTRTKVFNVQNQNQTEMIVDKLEVDIDVPNRYFSESALGTW